LKLLYDEFIDLKFEFIDKINIDSKTFSDTSKTNQFKKSSFLNDEITEAAHKLYNYNLELTEETEELNTKVSELYDIE